MSLILAIFTRNLFVSKSYFAIANDNLRLLLKLLRVLPFSAGNLSSPNFPYFLLDARNTFNLLTKRCSITSSNKKVLTSERFVCLATLKFSLDDVASTRSVHMSHVCELRQLGSLRFYTQNFDGVSCRNFLRQKSSGSTGSAGVF